MKIYFPLLHSLPPGEVLRSKQLGMSRLGNQGSTRQNIILAMQMLSCILLLTAALQVSAATNAQNTVSFTGKDVPLEQVFYAVKKQTGYTFVYYTEALKGAHRVTIDVKNLPVEEFLNVCLRDEPLTYKVIGQTVMIARREVIVTSRITDPGSPEIHGRVTNEKGDPLSGASVIIKGTEKGTVTAADGAFTFKNAGSEPVLIISYTGFEKKEIKVEKNQELSVTLLPALNPLDEAQVIAYGATTGRFTVGDITTVKSTEIESQPISNPLLALEGRVPGLFLTQSNGLPGTGVTVQIRGQNSIQNGTDPFYVIDGVPYESQLLPGLSGVIGSSGQGGALEYGSPLSFINPSDIESITVLKDAEATAIYGSRAANGAILITTKKGKAGQNKFDLNLQEGWGQVGQKIALMNTPEYLQMRDEALKNDGILPSLTNGNFDLLVWDTTRYTDWQKTLIGGTAKYTNLSASLSGGNLNTQYLAGATYHRETTVFPNNFSDQIGSFHFSLNSTSPNRKLKFQLTGNYQFNDNQLPNIDLTKMAMTLAPYAPALYNADGTLNWEPTSAGASTWLNPLAQDYNTFRNKTTNLVANALVSYQLLRGLDLRSSFGYTNLQANEFVAFPLVSAAPEIRAFLQGSAMFGNNNINTWIVEPQAEYKLVVLKGKLDLLAGTTFNQQNSNGQQLTAGGYNSDQVLTSLASATVIIPGLGTAAVYKYNAIFGRLNYNWQDKFIANFTIRRDGSSRFGPANQFHTFDAIGLGWIFSQENFIRDALPLISFGKIRASYGTTGNDQIGDYKYLNLYFPTTVSMPYQNASGLIPNSLTNPYLQWEETKKLEVGADLGLDKDRVLLSISYYQNRSSNQILGYNLPIITGFNSITLNFPATVQNYGWDVSLNSVNIKSKKFSWSTHITFSVPQNKLLAFPNLAISSYAGVSVIGQPITSAPVYKFLGVDPATGLYQFADGKATTSAPDTISDFPTARPVRINLAPRYYGGFGNTFTYRGVQLDILFQFVNQIAPNYYFGNSVPGGFYSGNQPVYLLNHWRQPGDIASHEKYNSDNSLVEQQNDAVQSSAGYSSASYIRLKNVSLSWRMPGNWQAKAHLQEFRLILLGQNLLTWTNYKGLDPETQNSQTLPVLRVVTAGAEIAF